MTRRRVIIRTTPQPADLNVNGNIFGGWVLSQMDLAGAAVARARAKGPVATVAVNGMKFHRPIEVGDMVSIYADVEKVGRTSVSVAIEVFAERGVSGNEHEYKVTEGCYVFVLVDDDGRPKPIDPE